MPGTRLSDLASSLGLNIATVSRALRDDPRVRPETRERVRVEADRLGYRPHVAARALAEGKTRTLWFIIPDLEDPIAREPAWHASQFLLDRGYDLLLAQHHNDESVFRRILDRLSRGGADGAIIIPDASSQGTADASLWDSRVPFVYLDRRLAGTLAASVVTTDNRAAIDSLVEALTSGPRGKPDLVVNAFGSTRENSVETVRRAAVDAAARRLGIPVVGPSAPFSGSRRPLVLASSEATALGLVGRLENPDTVGVGVFDAWRSGLRPATRVFVAVQDFRAMAALAVDRVLDQLGREPGPPPTEDLIPLARLEEIEEGGDFPLD